MAPQGSKVYGHVLYQGLLIAEAHFLVNCRGRAGATLWSELLQTTLLETRASGPAGQQHLGGQQEAVPETLWWLPLYPGQDVEEGLRQLLAGKSKH